MIGSFVGLSKKLKKGAGWVARRFINSFLPTGLVLMYHRVAEAGVDPWGLNVSPEHFREHVDYLDSHADVWRLKDYIRALRSKSLPDRAVVITFDDGYVDNLLAAAPMLKAAGLPATFFIVTGAIGQAGEFWWDDLERCTLGKESLSPKLMDEIASLAGLGAFREQDWEGDREQREVPQASQRALYDKLWHFAASESPESRSHFLAQLREATGTPASARPTHRTMTADELVSLSRISGMEVGAHGVTHTPLTALSTQEQRKEIVESKKWLQDNIDESIEAFSYPNGALGDETVDLLQEEGFSAACTTERGAVSRRTRPLMLPRLHVPDVGGEEFEEWLENQFRYVSAL